MKQNILDYSYEMRQDKKKKVIRNVILILSVILLISLIFKFLLFPVLVRSDSMESNVAKNGAVFVTPAIKNPERGDVVFISGLDDLELSWYEEIAADVIRLFTFQQYDPFTHSRHSSGKPCLRRVLGLPGDTVYMKDYILYIRPKGSSTFLTEFELSGQDYDLSIYSIPASWEGLGLYDSMDRITLGEDQYFMLSDNRIEASDSRLWGPVDGKKIIGKAILNYFPINRLKIY